MNLIYSLHDSFVKHSENYAFCIEDLFFSYQDLINCIAHIRHKITSNIKPSEQHIGLITNNDLETYASIFALWMEGKAYIPINPVASKSRNAEILSLTEISFVLDSSNNSGYSGIKVIHTSGIDKSKNRQLNPIEYDEKNNAYVLFTSGSTGVPKGIPISFKNLNALVTALDEDDEYKLNASDKCLQMYDLTFDASLTALLPALLSGACLYTVPSNAIKYFYITKLLAKYKLTVLKMVPSIIYYLRPYFAEIQAPFVRYSIFGGEKLYENVVKEWALCVPNATILNHYGPTEFTVCSHYYKFEAKAPKSYNGVLSIGKPLNNVDCLVLDTENQIVGTHVVGELCLSGNQLTSGYWKNDALNSVAFFMHKFKSGEVKRFYKTGDLCIKDHDGFYMYVGRKDFQVKIGGYRVELGEIEYHIRNHESVKSKNSVVIDVKNSNNSDELILVIESSKFDTENLLDYLKLKLVDYMIPKKVFFIESLPHNNNGKIDRNELRNLIRI